MRTYDCVGCDQLVATGRTFDGHPMMIDPDQVIGLTDTFVLLDIASDEPTIIYGVGDDGDQFSGIPAGAPRFRLHDCPSRC